MQLAEIYQIIENDLRTVGDTFADLIKSKDKEAPELSLLLNSALGGGKVVRPALAFLCARCFDYEKYQQNVGLFAAACELMHISTLVHDDAIDKAATRRGKPTVNSHFGTEKAVLLGDFMFAKAAEMVLETQNTEVFRLFTLTLQTITSGEIKQSFDLFRYEQDINDYNKRIYGKTASLIVLAATGGAILAGAKTEELAAIKEYALKTGMAFQIVDDILDFTGNEKVMGKPVGSDLKQGTITLPCLYYIEDNLQDNLVKKAFGEKKQNKREALLDKAVKEIVNPQKNYIQRAYDQATDYRNEALAALQKITDSQAKECLFNLADYLIKRNI